MTIDWSQLSSLIVAIGTVALAIYAGLTFRGLKSQMKLLLEQAASMKRQADAMDKQSKFIKDQSDAMTRQAKTMEAQFDIIRDESATMKRQADAMEGQSNPMLENMEYNRLSKRHERLNKEMTLLVGPLYARRKEKNIFQMIDRSERYTFHAKDIVNLMHHDYITFWENIDQYLYLNQSSELRRALGNYYQAIYNNFYFRELKMQSEMERNKEIFEKTTVPRLIEKIEERHQQLEKEIKDLENKR
jgi:uncharacterized protein YoxC